VIFGEQHLRHLLNSYQEPKKDAPIPRDVQSAGRVLALPILGFTIGTFGFEYPMGTGQGTLFGSIL
jgi:hypothetical protein